MTSDDDEALRARCDAMKPGDVLELPDGNRMDYWARILCSTPWCDRPRSHGRNTCPDHSAAVAKLKDTR